MARLVYIVYIAFFLFDLYEMIVCLKTQNWIGLGAFLVGGAIVYAGVLVFLMRMAHREIAAKANG